MTGEDRGDVRRLLHSIRCGVLAVRDDRIELVNPAFTELFDVDGSLAQDGASATHLWDAAVAVAAAPAAFRARVDAVVLGNAPVCEDVVLGDGRVLEWDFEPAPDSGQLWTVWDVSPDRAAESDRIRKQRAEIAAGQLGVLAHRARADEAERQGRRLEERNLVLTATDEARKELLATASHELRTPLTSILSFSELIADLPGSAPQVTQYAEVVHRNARRLLDTVEDLLMLASLGASSFPSSTAKVELAVVLTRTVEELAPISAAAGVTVAIEGRDVGFDGGNDAFGADFGVDGNADELARMISNLVDNAVKYSDPGSRVTVGLHRLGERIQLVVADRGTGIAEAEVALVFDEFYRAKAARDSGRPGTGLGLAVARGIAEQHGGAITLSSVFGRGTTVVVDLPWSP